MNHQPAWPEALPIRPRAVDCMLTVFDTGREVISTVNRGWKAGDSGPGGRCSRCPVCIAKPNGRCQITVNAELTEAQAWDLSLVDLGLSIDPR